MQTLESLKHNISSAEDLAGVVRTMKTLAAVSIRQYETATESLSVYSRTIETGLGMLLRDANHEQAEKQQSTSTGLTGAIVFGSDQGMCGQFNEQIGTQTAESLSQPSVVSRGVAPALCVGQRVSDKLTSAGFDVERTFHLPGSVSGITFLIQDLIPVIDAWRETHHIDRIMVFHNRRLSASTWRPRVQQLLPLRLDRLKGRSAKQNIPAARTLPLWTMESGLLFSRLVKQFLFVSLFQACAESLAGENASRIAAMQAAERNIRDRILGLRTDYAQQRQTTITEELLDVVTGFEALRQAEE